MYNFDSLCFDSFMNLWTCIFHDLKENDFHDEKQKCPFIWRSQKGSDELT